MSAFLHPWSAATWRVVSSLKVDCWLSLSVGVFLLSFCTDGVCSCLLVVARSPWVFFGNPVVLEQGARAGAGKAHSSVPLQSPCEMLLRAGSANLVASAAHYSEFRRRKHRGRS